MLFLFRSARKVEKRIHSKFFRKFWEDPGYKRTDLHYCTQKYEFVLQTRLIYEHCKQNSFLRAGLCLERLPSCSSSLLFRLFCKQELWRPDVGNILFLKYTIIVLMVVYHLSITAIDYSIVFQAPTYVRNWQRLNCPRWTPSQYHRPWVNICLNHSKSLMDTISVSQIKGWT